MRAALWLLGLFGVAVAGALLAGNNQGVVTLFWAPYRMDLSINLVVVVLLLAFALMHLALRALAALFELPHQARRWRAHQKERILHATVFDALAHLMAGRFLRARKAAEQGLVLAQSLETQELAHESPPPHLPMLRALVHLIAAESAHALRDQVARDDHLQQSLVHHVSRPDNRTAEVMDAARLSAARWSLSERDAGAALEWLSQLPLGTARRTLTLRLRLRAARMTGQLDQALDTARLLSKHGAFSPVASESLLRSLILARLDQCHDSAQLLAIWNHLGRQERQMPDIALHAARRLLSFEGEPQVALAWLLPLWTRWMEQPQSLEDGQQQRLIEALELAIAAQAPEAEWLARAEQARLSHPQHMGFLYLYGQVCMHHSLWGKAQQLLERCAPHLAQPALRHKAWCALAELAQQRGDNAAAARAWQFAAKVY